MTTSNPVIPRLETAAQATARQGWGERQNNWPIPRLNLWPLSDLVSIALVATFARKLGLLVVPETVPDPALRSLWPLIGASLCVALFWILGTYSSLQGPMNVRETEQLLRGMSIIAVLTALLLWQGDANRIFGTIAVSALTALLLVGQRGLARKWHLSRPARLRVLLYVRSLDAELLKSIQTISGHSLEVAGLLCDCPSELPEGCEMTYRLVAKPEDLAWAAGRTGASHVLVVGADVGEHDAKLFLQNCQHLKLHCSVLLDPRKISSARPLYAFMHELPVLRQSPIATGGPGSQLKRGVDVLVGLALVVAALPIGFLLAILVRLDSRGPILFRQERIGKDGRPFQLLKFRTMHTWAPRYHRSPASDSDPRITRIGRLLRRFSLDELPQLVNVVKGDMSLVGPRPEMAFIVEQYCDAAWARLSVRPGLTGLWQISRARSLPIHHNLHYDLFYIERQNIFLDLAILLRTFGAVIRGIGAA